MLVLLRHVLSRLCAPVGRVWLPRMRHGVQLLVLVRGGVLHVVLVLLLLPGRRALPVLRGLGASAAQVAGCSSTGTSSSSSSSSAPSTPPTVVAPPAALTRLLPLLLLLRLLLHGVCAAADGCFGLDAVAEITYEALRTTQKRRC